MIWGRGGDAASGDDASCGLSRRQPRRILAVDDSPTYLNELSEQLRDEGFDPILAPSGVEALEVLDTSSVEAVLLDLVMEGLPGDEVCRRIKANPALRGLPVIMLTLRILARLLRALGHEVTTAATLKAALEAADIARFDLLISDIGLPDGSGLDIMRQLRERAITGIALSGFSMEQDVQASLNAGFKQHLTKPIDFDRLQAIVQSEAHCLPTRA